jgi:hypothetical protein
MKKFLAWHMAFKKELRPHFVHGDEHDPSTYKINWHDETRYTPLAAAPGATNVSKALRL